MLPVTNKLVHYKGKEEKIQAKNFMMGDKKGKAVAAALARTECQKANLKNNRLSPPTGKLILESMSERVLELNLERNNLGKSDVFLDALIKHVGKYDCSLQVLNLSHNGISDRHVLKFCAELVDVKNQTLRKLKLAHN